MILSLYSKKEVTAAAAYVAGQPKNGKSNNLKITKFGM